LAGLGHPANFNGFRVLALLLQQRHSMEANQTLHDVWPPPGLVDYLYIFGSCCPVTEFCQVQNSLCALQVLHCPILAALLHSTRAVGASQTFTIQTVIWNFLIFGNFNELEILKLLFK